MSRPTEPTVVGRRLDAAALEERGYKECEHCGGLLPVSVSRCRRRRCPGYAPTWARDTMRKIRENLRAYGGLVAMCTLTAPGEDLGLIWDREQCLHPRGVRCSGRKFGCKVVPAAAELWNRESRGWWRELNRRAKQRADRAVKRLGHDYKGGLLMYEWELQKRGVWHLHFVLGMETAVERVWGFEYVAALAELGPSCCYGFVDSKPPAHIARHMATATSHGHLTAEQRQALRAEIDRAVRAKLAPPRNACPECGTDLRDRRTPVYGCTTCANRYWRRRQRASV